MKATILALLLFICVSAQATKLTVNATAEGSIECTICEYLVNIAEQWVASNHTEAEIIAELNKACNDLGFLASICTSLVDEYAPELIQYLINKENPDTACSQIGLCSSAQKMIAAKLTPPKEVKKAPEVKVTGSLECTICEYLVNIAEQWVASNHTESEIVAELDKVCNDLGFLASTCTSLVNTYAPELIQLLINKENPDTVCTQVGLCSAAQAILKPKTTVDSPPVPPKAVKANSELCTICEYLVQIVEQWIQANKTEQEIINDLELVCNFLGSYKTTCDALLQNYVPEMIQMLLNYEDPDTVCTQLTLCSPSNKSQIPKKLLEKAMNSALKLKLRKVKL